MPLEEKKPRVQSCHHLAQWPQPSKHQVSILIMMVGGVQDDAPANYLSFFSFVVIDNSQKILPAQYFGYKNSMKCQKFIRDEIRNQILHF